MMRISLAYDAIWLITMLIIIKKLEAITTFAVIYVIASLAYAKNAAQSYCSATRQRRAGFHTMYRKFDTRRQLPVTLQLAHAYWLIQNIIALHKLILILNTY